MQAGIGGQPNGDRADPGSLGWGLAWLSGSLSAVRCVGLHCSAGSAGSCWLSSVWAFAVESRLVGDDSS